MTLPRIALLDEDDRLPRKRLGGGLERVLVGTIRPVNPPLGTVFIDCSGNDTTPPSDLAGLVVTPRAGGLRVVFAVATDLDLHHYEYRLGAENPITTAAVSVGQANDFMVTGLIDGTGVWIQVRAVDTSLNGGPWSAALYRVPGAAVIEDGLLSRWDASALPAGKLAQWDDQVGGFHLTQANAAQQPTVVAQAYGSRSAVRFSGSVLLNRAITPQPYAAGAPGVAVTQILVARYAGALPAPNFAFVSTFDADSVDANLRKVAGGAGGFFYVNAGSSLVSTVAVDNALHVIAMRGNDTLRVDGVSSSGYSGARGMKSLQLGTDRSRTAYTEMEVCEVLLYARQLDTSELDETVAALRVKWGQV